jgi:uncharacterized SAM-binding protein YcdF (DUF218 family)
MINLPGIFIIIPLLLIFFVKKRQKVFLLSFSLFMYVLSISPTREFLLVPLEYAYKIPSINEVKLCDAYVVLGGGVNDNAPHIDGKGSLSNDALARVVGAYRLYLISQKPIILSGGKIFNRASEAEIAKKFLLSLGVKENHLLIETKSKDTYENAQYTKEICEQHNIKRILLVTSALHMKRSVMLFHKFFHDITPYSTGYKTLRIGYDILSFLPDAGNMSDISLATKEYLGILFYKITR